MPILEMAGLGDIRLSNPTPEEARLQQMLSEFDDGSQHSLSRNMSSSPSMARSPGLPNGTSAAQSVNRMGSTYPPLGFPNPTPFGTLPDQQNQYTMQNAPGSYLAVPGTGPQDILDESQDPNYLTTSMHTYPPPALGHRRSVSATRSPTQSWLSPDFDPVADLTAGNVAMQRALAQPNQQAQSMAFPQPAQDFTTTMGADAGYYATSPTYTAPNPNVLTSEVAFDGFPTPVSHSHSQNQSRMVSPNPQQQDQAGLQSMGPAMGTYQGAPTAMYVDAANGSNSAGLGLSVGAYTNAATYPGRTSTADDIAANINIVRRQLAFEAQAQQQAQQQQAQQQAQQQQQQQQQFQQQQNPFFDEPQDFQQSGQWASGMYQVPVQAGQPQYMANQAHMHHGAQVPYTSAPQG